MDVGLKEDLRKYLPRYKVDSCDYAETRPRIIKPEIQLVVHLMGHPRINNPARLFSNCARSPDTAYQPGMCNSRLDASYPGPRAAGYMTRPMGLARPVGLRRSRTRFRWAFGQTPANADLPSHHYPGLPRIFNLLAAGIGPATYGISTMTPE